MALEVTNINKFFNRLVVTNDKELSSYLKMTTNYTEQDLIEALRGGDETSFAMFIDRYKNLVYSLCLKMLSNREEAEEVAQDSFIKAFDSINNFKGNSKLSTWLYSIVYRSCLDRLKSKNYKNRTESLDIIHNISDDYAINALESMERQDLSKSIKKCLEELDADDSFLITLFYFKDHSLEEIGSIMNITANNAKVKLHRARKKLTVIFKNKLQPEISMNYERA